MPRKTQRNRVYWRMQGGERRAYADFRDLGGGREALIPAGRTKATTDPDLAASLAADREAELRGQRRAEERLGLNPAADLASYAALHLRAKEESGKHAEAWLDTMARYLDLAINFFVRVQPEQEKDTPEWTRRRLPPGARNLLTISPPDVRQYARWLAQQKGRGGQTWAPGTVRHALNVLSGLYSRAASDGLLQVADNPVAALLDKPTGGRSKTPLLEPWEIALLLESARTAGPLLEARHSPVAPFIYELVACFAYTGAREDEVRRADVGDLFFERARIIIHGARKDGRGGQDRIVPMHPHLHEILLAYVRRRGLLGGPLFAGADGEPFGKWTAALDLVAQRAGFPKGYFRTRALRTAYATWRSTCDDVPNADIVRGELGHSGRSDILERIYNRAQLRTVRMGSEFSYRLERWCTSDECRERLAGITSWKPARTDASAGVVSDFLRAYNGISAAVVERETGVDAAVLNKLRAGTQTTVKGRNQERMRTVLQSAREPRAVVVEPSTQANRVREVESFLETIEGRTLEEVAGEVGLPVGTVKDLRQGRRRADRLHARTRAAIRAWLQERGHAA